MESDVWTGLGSLIRAMSLLRDEKRRSRLEHTMDGQQVAEQRAKVGGLPDSVRVPSLVDDDLGGTEVHGTGLIALQIVFPQVDPVGVTAAWA